MNMIASIPRRAYTRVKRDIGFVRRRFVSPPRPRNAGGPLLIHLGCGTIDSPEFVNVDALAYPHVHFVRDNITDLSIFESGSADLIYMCHVLEHVPRKELVAVLKELRRVLRQGGVLRLSVPDFDLMLAMYEAFGKDVTAIADPLLGSHANPYDIHYAVFNRKHLDALLREAGFREVRSWDPENCAHHDFKDWASRKIERDGRSFAVSLNLEGVK